LKTKDNINILLIGIATGAIGILVKLAYRPYIINHNINDIGIQGYAPNFFTVLSLSLIAAYFTKSNPIKTMMAVTLGVLFYEIEQIWTSWTFDYMDIIASLLGLGVAVLILKKLEALKKISQ